jgi:hypothetical protein
VIAAFVTGGVVLLAIVSLVVWLAVSLGDARVNDATKAGRIAILEAEVKTQTARGDSEQRRADALDEELEAVALDGDAAGARGRVLARWKRKAGDDSVPTAGGDPSPVHDATAASAVGSGASEDLERPGE